MSSIESFLYGKPPHGGMPDSTIRVGVAFEAGGTYETWGWVVERMEYVEGSVPAVFRPRTLGAGRTLDVAIEKATARILADLAADAEAEKCWCGKAMAIYQVIDGEKVPFCGEHNGLYGDGTRGPTTTVRAGE